MRRHTPVCAVALVALSGCGLESVFANIGHGQYDRPASKITGTAPAGIQTMQLSVIDGDGNSIMPFLASVSGTTYELRLPSAKYSMLRVRADIGNMELRALVPSIGEESAVEGVDLDARNMTETLITEARLSADAAGLKQVTPDAYLGTRKLIRAALDTPGPTQDLLNMVSRVMKKYDMSLSVSSPNFFNPPVLDTKFAVKTSPLDNGFVARNPFDYVGDGRARIDSGDFDAKLAAVAMLYRPAGCPDPGRIRLVFTVDFNQGGKNGNCGSIDRFKWAVDKPGKGMFFVGWVHKESDIQDPNVNSLVGGSTPNQLPMYDDGTNGDQTSGDNIWTLYFDVPRSTPPKKILRIGYKYTWGVRGAPWTGSEEWPGNSRILEVVDDNADEFVYRHDVFGDEATNKDNSNLNLGGTGSITWTTDLHGCGTPETHENKYDDNSCKCGSVLTPKWIGPLTVTCM